MIHISFIEETVLNPDYQGYIGGRIEVHHPTDGAFPSEEIRFFTKDTENFNIFRLSWDMAEITPAQLAFVKYMIKGFWCDV